MSASEKLTKARSQLILDEVFYGCLVLRLEMKEGPVETLCTDGREIVYDPAFIDSFHLKYVRTFLAHEVLHVALGHIWRGEGKNGPLWNIAADFVVNLHLKDCNFPIPEGALIDEKYRDKSVEEVYNELYDELGVGNSESTGGSGGTGNGAGDGNGKKKFDLSQADPGGMGGITTTCLSKEEQKILEEDWKIATSQALDMAKNQGNMPAHLERALLEMLDPELPWQILLADFVQKTAKNDYCWTRPSRVYLSRGFVLPSMISDELPEICIGNDTSGSMTEHELAKCAAEVSSLLAMYQTTARVYHCDAAVNKVEVYTQDDLPIKLSMVGGGGTDFRPVFDKIEQEGITPCCLVYFTDLYGTFPSIAPNYPVVWVTKTKDVKVPFGEVILFKNK